MQNEKQPAKSTTGLLSTKQVMKLLGVSMKALRYYSDIGVCKPAYSDNNNYRYYEVRQMYEILLAKASKDMNLRVKEFGNYIADDFSVDYASLMEHAYQVTAGSMREARRALKNIVHCQQSIADIKKVGYKTGFYLRYIPQRWFALLPVSSNAVQPPDSLEAVNNLMTLKQAVSVFGWADTLVFGSLISATLKDASDVDFTFVELSSPPMPEVTGRRIIDGGCYRSVDPIAGDPGCLKHACADCARFGRELTESDLWVKGANSELEKFTLMMDELEEPYPTGQWSDFTKSKIAARTGQTYSLKDFEAERLRVFQEAHKKSGKSSPPPQTLPPRTSERPPNPTLKPRLMPHVVRLPKGITACVLPSGYYLCLQHKVGQEKESYDKLHNLAQSLPKHALTLDDELDARNRAILLDEDLRAQTSKGKGPFVEPFAASRTVGDPDKFGWHKDFDPQNPSGVVVLSNTGLTPDADVCIVDSLILLPAPEGELLKELQVMVTLD